MTVNEFARGPRGCPTDCSGGWRPVNPEYARSIANPQKDPARYAAALNSVYPCATCRPETFQLWAEGHKHPDHVRTGGCPDCRPGRKVRHT
jgi:hypothetical protein